MASIGGAFLLCFDVLISLRLMAVILHLLAFHIALGMGQHSVISIWDLGQLEIFQLRVEEDT
jgi:hypothetical protein